MKILWFFVYIHNELISEGGTRKSSLAMNKIQTDSS